MSKLNFHGNGNDPKKVEAQLKALAPEIQDLERRLGEQDNASQSSQSAEVKAVTLEPWTDAELDAMAEITEDDIAAALGSATPEMRALLTATPDDAQ